MRHALKAMAVSAMMSAMMSPGGAHAATPADTLVIARDISAFLSLDPQEAFEIASGDTLNNLYLRLVQHDPRDFRKIIPGAAERWEASADGRQVVFKIRSGLKFQSGNPLTAEDAAFSLRRGVLLDKPPSIILRQFGWSKDNVGQKVRAEGDRLIVSFDRPYALDLVLSAFSAAIASVVDSKLVMANERNGDLGNAWLRTRSAGAGAYRLLEWKAKDAVVIEAFPGYAGGAAPRIRRVIVRHVAEAAAQRLLLDKGDVDVAADLNPDQVRAIASNPDLKVVQVPRDTVFYLALNQANPILAKPEVWQAARWLVDYDGIANQLFRGQYKVNQAPVAQGMAGALPERPYKLDVAKAKALLAKAGLGGGFTVSVDAMAATPYREIAQSLQSTFGQVGIVLDLRVAEPSQVLTRYRERRHDMIVFVWSPDYSDPSSTIEFFARNTDNGAGVANKNAAWRNHWLIPQLTVETEQASREIDPPARVQRYGHLQRVLRDDSPFVFMMQKDDPVAMRKNVQNYGGGVTFDSTHYHIIEKK
ncbi:ABC transporter substrate-binding protein [Verminephrobacter eiseniae]|uniref:ABC transporter substrate-binding protein n=1 Tax=Verminephrobacter eiseniae TaxID=364317 RepID=UPI002237587F|nr:ABC transporter substrate-binding protein [Verminephrobacter eiseniae]MCW5259797.1 ABC transporter substrate-binding protein [Verminephrobacter eiseniae]